MNPWLLFTLASAIPGLLTKDGGYDELLKIINRIASPDALSADTNRLFNLFTTSPGYTSALHAALGSARASTGSAERSLAASGLGESGVGSIARAVGSGVANRAVGDVNTNAFNSAFAGAQSLMSGRLGTLGLPQPRNIPMDTIGALLAALGQSYRPGGGGGGSNAAGNPANPGPFNINTGNNINDIFNILRGRS